jgi:hypothetical protein
MSVRPLPLKLDTTTFNPNYYFTPGEYLENYGTQRLQGTFQVSKTVTYGNETVYGDSSFKDEPTIMSITDPEFLTSNHLVSKSYVDSKIIINPYPQIFVYGKAYTGSPVPVGFSENIQIIKFTNNFPVIQSIYVEVIYDVQRGQRNTLSRDSAIQRESIYNIVYYKTNGVFTSSTIELVSGDNLTRDYGGYQPFDAGISNGDCCVMCDFPKSPTSITSDNWISSYGITIRILNSTPGRTNQFLLPELSYSNAGSAYFEDFNFNPL